jgi:hypothetical protein
MRLKLRTKKKPSTERRSRKTVDEYICINGKKLSEQTIYDYAQFIPKWEDRIKLGEESFMVSCVFPENHINGDDPARSSVVWDEEAGRYTIKHGSPSLMISKGHTQNVVINCRKKSCSNEKLRQYFLSRLIGEVNDPSSFKYVPSEKTKEQLAKEFEHRWYSRKSWGRDSRRRIR